MSDFHSPVIVTGPFRQLLTMDNLPPKGSLKDVQLQVFEEAGIAHRDGKILEIGVFSELCRRYDSPQSEVQHLEGDLVALPGLIDAHTHLCFAGSRENDYALRLEGVSYSEIAQNGGGIWDTVTKTRNASSEDLRNQLIHRATRQLKNGITTSEVKSGYALNLAGELRLLEIINSAGGERALDMIPTCLAAHIKPKDFAGGNADYLQLLVDELLPAVKASHLSNRIDIFVEEGAFGVIEAENYLKAAKNLGFDLVVHGEQFTSGGVSLAVKVGARSVDHLEFIERNAMNQLANSGVVAMALPGASIGLGCQFAPARKLLDAGCCLAIGSDWNPGSAPMGDLLVQTSILGTFEKLTMAEQLSAITFRAAHALNLEDRGILKSGNIADFIAFPGRNYKEILYHQGALKPSGIWKRGRRVSFTA